MDKTRIITRIFIVAALFDLIVGAALLLFQSQLFAAYGVTAPNHPGYVQFPAELLLIFGLMFWRIAKNPIANRHMIPYGIMLKVVYCSVVFGHWATNGMPDTWKPFAFGDLLFLVLFVWAYRETAPTLKRVS